MTDPRVYYTLGHFQIEMPPCTVYTRHQIAASAGPFSKHFRPVYLPARHPPTPWQAPPSNLRNGQPGGANPHGRPALPALWGVMFPLGSRFRRGSYARRPVHWRGAAAAALAPRPPPPRCARLARPRVVIPRQPAQCLILVSLLVACTVRMACARVAMGRGPVVILIGVRFVCMRCVHVYVQCGPGNGQHPRVRAALRLRVAVGKCKPFNFVYGKAGTLHDCPVWMGGTDGARDTREKMVFAGPMAAAELEAPVDFLRYLMTDQRILIFVRMNHISCHALALSTWQPAVRER
mmetsp:Transcript_28829/g.74003  ORF Transcript_28829/g.74003 Transcript_28829/m.74003 type:complete len:292 (-) Transcript_28829:1023-1898(-)